MKSVTTTSFVILSMAVTSISFSLITFGRNEWLVFQVVEL
jgi:hypothetical protein